MVSPREDTEAATGIASIKFSSWVPAAMRPSVERLFFFNPQQHSLKSRIRDTVVETGTPYIVEDSGRVQLAVASGRLQCLFARSSGGDLLGIALYDRPGADRLRICHLVVEPEHCGSGEVEKGLTFAVVEKVRLIGRSISGVELIQLPYRRNSCLSVARPMAGRN